MGGVERAHACRLELLGALEEIVIDSDPMNARKLPSRVGHDAWKSCAPDRTKEFHAQ